MARSQRSCIDFRDEGSLHPRLFKISTEQQIILSKDSAWHISLSNIPPIVLDNVKEHLARQREQTAPTVVDTLPKLLDGERNRGNSPEVVHEAERFDSQPENSDGEDDERGSHWESSPAHHRYPPGYVPEQLGGTIEDGWIASAPYSTNPPTQAHGHAAEVEAEDEEPADDFVTQLPEPSPPQPTATKSLRATRPTFDFPSSSLGQEDEMEVEVPTGLGAPVLPFNLTSASVMATPPSAQVVPCSLDPSGLHLHHEHHEHHQDQPTKPNNKPGIRQTRYAPVTTLYRPPKETDTSTNPVTNAPEGHAQENEKSSLPHTFPDTSSSIVPSTHQDSSRPMDTSQDLQEQQSQIQAGPTIHDKQAQRLDATEANADPFETQQHAYDAPVPLTAQPVPTTTVTKVVSPPAPQPKKDLAPYAHFCDTYRDYTGNIQSFITACFYIQLQQKKIRSSLYDDFIRAWHDGYYAYVKSCDRADPPIRAVHAYAWYNEMDDDPVYTARVITKPNLEATLEFYPEIVKAAQKTLGIIPEEQPKSILKDKLRDLPKEKNNEALDVRPPAVKEVEGPAAMVSLPAPPQQQSKPAPQRILPAQQPIIIDDVNEDEDDVDEDIPMENPRAAIFSRHQQRRASPPPADFSKSMSEIDLWRQPSPASAAPTKPAARSLARSFSEASRYNHKRKASTEMIEQVKTAKRPPSVTGFDKPNNPAVPSPARPQTMRPPPRPGQPEQQQQPQPQLQPTFPSPSAFSTRSTNPNSKTNTPPVVSRQRTRMSLPAAAETPSSSAISLSFRPPSSTAGSTTSTTTKKRRYANDPEKRKLMFKKFCERTARKVNEESIMSSAPTSAQRE